MEDIRWYFEVYANSYTADVDNQRAKRVEFLRSHFCFRLIQGTSN
ncbi:hypothetical protein [Nostoc sp.]